MTTKRPAPTSPEGALGPENWFTAWWLQQGAQVTPSVAADAEGSPLFAALSLDELALIEVVLSRAWAEQHDDWQAPEAAFLAELRGIFLDRGATLRESGGDAADGTVRLSLPGIDQLPDDALASILDELWHIEGGDVCADWLDRQLATADFVTLAQERPQLRRLAVTAIRLRPSAEAQAVLRALYRDPTTQASVVSADAELLDRDSKFRETVSSLGIHAPLNQEPLYPQGGRPGGAPAPDGEVAAAVTVLIPSFKHEQYIEDTIRSALGQSRDDVVVMVVDDQSPDGTVERARAIEDPRLDVWVNEHNVGLGRSILGALDSIETPYVAILNSDDLYHPDRIARCLEVLEADQDATLVATGMDFADAAGHRLTAESSCALDVGKNAHEWLAWYRRVTQGLQEAGDWTATSSLLRHNHLATSSNIVTRTDFLRAHAAEIQPLNYCVDWLLFLSASVSGGLRFIADPLLAYRFHESNTVWFERGGRTQYILEVNWVSVSALRRVVAKLRENEGPTAARAELAELLDNHVSQHGESHGLASLFTEILGGLPPGDELMEDIDQFVQGLMDRRTPAAELEGLAGNRGQARVDAYVAEGYVHRARSLEVKLQEVREAVDDLERRLKESYDQHGVIATERNVAAAARDSLDQQLRSERQEWESKAADLTQRLERTSSERDDYRAEVARRGEQINDLVDAVTMVSALRDADQAHSRRYKDSEEWRAGQFILHRMRLLGPWKTLRRAAAHASAGWQRRFARTPERSRAMLVWGGTFPSADRADLVWEARCLLEAGLDLRLLCWDRGSDDMLTDADAALLSRVKLLNQDASLATADRQHFEQRDSAAVTEVLDLNAGDPAVCSRLFTLARSSEQLGAGYLHGFGLGESAALAHGAAAVLDVPYGLAVTGRDLQSLYDQPTRGVTLLAGAAVVVADSHRTAAVLREVSDGDLPSLIVKPPAAYWEEPRPRTERNGAVHAAVASAAAPWEVLPVADAFSRVAVAGTPVAVEMLGDARPGSPFADVMQPHLQARGLAGVVSFREERTTSLDACLDRAAMLVAPSGAANEPETSVIPTEALAAMAAGVPVIAGHGSVLAEIITDGEHGLLVNGRDPDALASAIKKLATDNELSTRLGHQARARFIADLAPAVSAAELRGRIRAILEARGRA